jgi:hypothetical protein
MTMHLSPAQLALQKRILQLIAKAGSTGCTLDELYNEITKDVDWSSPTSRKKRVPKNEISARLSDLSDAGRIANSGCKRKGFSKTPIIVWVLAKLAPAAIALRLKMRRGRRAVNAHLRRLSVPQRQKAFAAYLVYLQKHWPQRSKRTENV